MGRGPAPEAARPRSGRGRPLLNACVLLALAVGGAVVAGRGSAGVATTTTTTSTSTTKTVGASVPPPQFAVEPALTGKTSLPGGHFTYGITAGGEIRDAFVLYNYTGKPLKLQTYSADVVDARNGGLVPLQETAKMTSVGLWLHIKPKQVTVSAHGTRTVPFVLEVPKGTPPGNYVGAIVAAANTPVVRNGFRIQYRIARLVELTVPGKASLKVVLGGPTGSRSGSSERLVVGVENTGNVTFGFSLAEVIVGTGSKSVVVALRPVNIYVVPGGHTVLHGTWTNVPASGSRTAYAELWLTYENRPHGLHKGPSAVLELSSTAHH